MLEGLAGTICSAADAVLPQLMLHTCDIIGYNLSEGDLGESVRSPFVRRAAVKCLVQERSDDKVNEFNQNELRITHVIYFDANPQAQDGDSIRTDGKDLEILGGIRDTDRLGKLFVASCREMVGKP